MNHNTHILLVEDDPNFGMILKDYLELNDFTITHAIDGEAGLTAFKEGEFDLCILDIMMPKMDGFTLAGEIRKIEPQQPFIFLSAKSMKEDILKGYKAGADDYLTKPFDSEILLHKINAVLSRSLQDSVEEEKTQFGLGSFTYNSKLRELSQGGEIRKLSPKEGELLKLLILHKNDLMPRSLALNKIWGDDNYFTGRSMDVYVAKLRKYLKVDDTLEIENIHSEGFRLIDRSAS